jgi:hypothetical protein
MFDSLEHRFMQFFTSTHQINLFHSSIFEIKNYSNEIFQGLPPDKIIKIKEFLGSQAWQFRITQLELIDSERKGLWSTAKRPILTLFVMLNISIILLPFSGTIHKCFFCELFLFISVIGVESFGLILLIKLIINQTK